MYWSNSHLHTGETFITLWSAFDRPHFLISCHQYSDARKTSRKKLLGTFYSQHRGRGEPFTDTLSHSRPPTHMHHACLHTHTYIRTGNSKCSLRPSCRGRKVKRPGENPRTHTRGTHAKNPTQRGAVAKEQNCSSAGGVITCERGVGLFTWTCVRVLAGPWWRWQRLEAGEGGEPLMTRQPTSWKIDGTMKCIFKNKPTGCI